MQKHKKILLNHNLEFENYFQSVIQIVGTGFHVKSNKMGNVLACCTVVERQANDDSMETTEESLIVKAAIAKELLSMKRSSYPRSRYLDHDLDYEDDVSFCICCQQVVIDLDLHLDTSCKGQKISKAIFLETQ